MAAAHRHINTRRTARRCAAVLALFSSLACAQDAASLRARHAALLDALTHNQFQRPLVIESSQSAGDLKGEIFSVVDTPHASVQTAVQSIDHWCDILTVHLLVKDCRAAGNTQPPTLSLAVARTWDQSLADAHHIDFHYKVVATSPDYLHVQLNADAGPMGTKNYRLMLEAVPLDAKRTFIHMSYSYGYGFAARLAMEGYLATLGRNKVGFSITGRGSDGKPVYMGNVRGVVERNTMRYYLAIEAYLGALGLPPAEQSDRRLRDWYTSIERYPVQLHELERSEYLEMKRKELLRQQAAAKP
ncbi:MAG: hypothetical protein ABI433_06110 [Burkholderiaceae bacterium]